MSTKSLAKELGLIRKRSHSTGARQRPSACIEFPAVLLNVSSGAVESEFHSYVQPQEHPALSDFCTELTGITQDQVDSAPPLHVCLSKFSRWLQSLQQEKGVVFQTDSTGPAPTGQPCACVTWSDWDLGVCLLYECKRKQLSVPEALKSWIDLRATYRLFYNRKPKGLRGALLDLGIQFTGREHSGLVDARNTALLAHRMMTDGCLLTLTKTLRRAPLKPRPVCVSVSSERPSAQQQTSVCRSLVWPRTVLSCTHTPSRAPGALSALAALSDTTYDPEASDACWRDGVLLTEEEEPGRDDTPLGAEPGAVQRRASSCSGVFKAPRAPRPLSRSFSVYTDPPAGAKITAPLCVCGRRARRLTVNNRGPNHGRAFYSCPVRRRACGFFRWSGSQNLLRPPQTCSRRLGSCDL
ncbi:ERI1 exoribonuclease 2 isoform X2 [Puntigrus tetrazona]|uniref:ERI1 exoribonuclease 2 isoform X2 n=1 Tax=Puntigrus tetrazona TaxID=1606681 RepID=UPI001C89D195|nr:ERI1 exoribonuclease 2 isoform X2 [Puntigrus tetrazona]